MQSKISDGDSSASSCALHIPDSFGQPQEKDTEDLNKKVSFLQNYEFFANVPSKTLFRIALAMEKTEFTYGDYIQRKGEVPRGMILIS